MATAERPATEAAPPAPRARTVRSSNPSVLIVGAGFGGIGAAIELARHGIDDVTLLERADGVGGTWFHNTYPGAACDVPSHLYSFSFDRPHDWSRLCAPQSEILGYLERVAREHGVAERVRFGTTVTACAWDAERARWRVETRDGPTYEADLLVLATGQLHQAATPRIPGLEDFAGHSFHSAAWDHDHDLRGERVAVIGTGASAVQFVPEIAKDVAHLDVFQRSGNWFMPRENHPYPRFVRERLTRVPGVQAFRRTWLMEYLETVTRTIRNPDTLGRLVSLRSRWFMRRQLRDAEVRRKVWPDYTFGCKRVLFSSHFLPALQRENVEVHTDAIERIVPEGLVTADGTTHAVDTIVWGTGFRTNDFMFPMAVRGRDGQELADAWAGGPHAHLGMTVPGFPNLFVMYGPNTNTSGGSIVVYLEAQARYLRQAAELLRRRGMGSLEVREDVEAASDRAVQERFEGTAWQRCDSWYRTGDGRIVANWPDLMRDYLAATATLDDREFVLAPLPSPA